MMNIFYDFVFLPVSYQVGIIALLSLFYLLIKVPMFVWSLTIAGVLYLYMVDYLFVIAGVLAIFSIPFIRQHLISRFILKLTQVFKIFPKVSDTEQVALDAGTVWMDKELFSGAPNI